MPSRTIPVKILGERNTGTHYLEKLLRLNLDVRVLPGSAPRRLRRHFPGNEAVLDLYFRLTAFANLGWKHALAPAPDALRRSRWARRGLVILTLSKNPYAWLLSLYRHPYHYSGPLPSFERFLQSPWRTVRRERCSDVLPDPVALWNLKNASYLGLRSYPRCLNLRYEDLLTSPEATIVRIRDQFSLRARAKQFDNVEKSTKEPGKDFTYYRDYYLNERWRQELSAEAVRLINERLDASVARALGYEILAADSIAAT